MADLTTLDKVLAMDIEQLGLPPAILKSLRDLDKGNVESLLKKPHSPSAPVELCLTVVTALDTLEYGELERVLARQGIILDAHALVPSA